MKKNILKIKDQPSVICYINLLQNNIARMSNYSGIIKAAMCVIYTIIISILLTIEKLSQYWWIALLITLLGVVMDSYYLALEKIYVIKYNKFIRELNDNKIIIENIYDMNPKNTNLSCEFLAMMLSSVKSFSVIGFYFIFVIISIAIKFI